MPGEALTREILELVRQGQLIYQQAIEALREQDIEVLPSLMIQRQIVLDQFRDRLELHPHLKNKIPAELAEGLRLAEQEFVELLRTELTATRDRLVHQHRVKTVIEKYQST